MSDAPLLHGNLESPSEVVDATATRLRVSGWVFCPNATVCALELRVDGGDAIPLVYGLPRADVVGAYSDPRGLCSGFGGQLRMPLGIRTDVHLSIDVLTEDGLRIERFKRTVRFGTKSDDADRGPSGGWRRALMSLRDFTQRLARTTRGHSSALPGRSMDGDRFEASFRGSMLASGGRRVVLDERLVVDIIALVNEPANARALVSALKSAPFEWRLRLVVHGDLARFEGVEASVADSRRIEMTAVSTDGRDPESWLPPGDTGYVVLLSAHAIPVAGALQEVVHAAISGEYDWLYPDDARLDAGEVRDAYLKGQFSPELALTDDFATRLAVVRRVSIEGVGGLRLAFATEAVRDLLARITDAGGRIGHLPVIGCYRTGERSSVDNVSRRQAVETALRSRIGAPVSIEPVPAKQGTERLQITWPSEALDRLAITIVIPTRDRVDLLDRCVSSLRATVDPRRTRVLIVDDRSADGGTHDWFRRAEADRTLECRVVRAPAHDGGFNYSALMNFGTSLVDTPLTLQLNNDIEAIAPGWLDRMCGWFLVPAIGVVGAKLLYPDRTIQHAGVAVTPAFGTPEHLFHGLNGSEGGYQGLANRLRNVAAVTGACLLTRTELFLTLGGFDRDHLAVQFNDIDYCLRVMEAGRRIVYEPAAELVHAASATRGSEIDFDENLFFLRKYAAFRDPYISPHLDVRSLCSPTPLVLPRRID